MEISTLSNDSMSITCSEEAKQENELKNIRLLLEDAYQDLHATKKKLEICQQIKAELVLEVEKQEASTKTISSRYEAEKAELLNTHSRMVNELQSLLYEEREQNKQIRNSFSELQKKFQELQTAQDSKHFETLDSRVMEEKFAQDTISQLEQELAEKKKELFFFKAQVTEKINDMQKENDNLKETMKCKSESLQEALNTLEELKEEKALMSSELIVLKAGPVEELGRGNSLFSEIEDKRANLENKLAIMHKKYLEMKRTLVLKSNELENIKRENMNIRFQWEEDEKDINIRENKLLSSYKKRIEELSHRVSELELRPETPKIITISDKNLANMQWVHTIVEDARAEVRNLKRALELKSTEKLYGEENMYRLKLEVVNLKRQATKDKAVVEDLKIKLTSLENCNKSEPTFETDKQESAKKVNGKIIRFADDVKENDGVPLRKESKKKEIQYPIVFVDTTNQKVEE